jgi:hypothetical protein
MSLATTKAALAGLDAGLDAGADVEELGNSQIMAASAPYITQ